MQHIIVTGSAQNYIGKCVASSSTVSIEWTNVVYTILVQIIVSKYFTFSVFMSITKYINKKGTFDVYKDVRKYFPQ